MQYATCRHIKTNGLQCKSPAVLDTAYCYFHTHLHRRHQPYRATTATRGYLIPGQHLELVALEDAESVQLALSLVINALATGNLDARNATALLYGLRLAGINARHLDTQPYAPNIVLNPGPSPEGLNLAEPGTVIEILDPQPMTEQEEQDLLEGCEPDEEEEEERPYALRRT